MARHQSMAVAYGMRRKQMDGGGCEACRGGRCLAHGGAVTDGDMVGRIMAKRKPLMMAEGGDDDYDDDDYSTVSEGHEAEEERRAEIREERAAARPSTHPYGSTGVHTPNRKFGPGKTTNSTVGNLLDQAKDERKLPFNYYRDEHHPDSTLYPDRIARDIESEAKGLHSQVMAGLLDMRTKRRTNLAEGGAVERIMAKRKASGLEPDDDDDDTHPIADSENADYDLESDLDFHESPENSGDELGEKDAVSRIMRKRKKSA